MKKIIFLLIPISILLIQNIHSQSYPPVSPKWVFEPWVWEDEGTAVSLESMVTEYLARDIPVGAVILDSPWEEPNTVLDKDNLSYNTFRFDDTKYFGIASLIDSFHGMANPIKVILWITGNMTTNCIDYPTDAHASKLFVVNNSNPSDITTGFWKGNKIASHFDYYYNDARDHWRDKIESVLGAYNIDGWKVDGSDYYIRAASVTNSLGDSIKDNNGSVHYKIDYANKYYDFFYNTTKDYFENNSIPKLSMIMARPYSHEKIWSQEALFFAPKNVNTAGWVGDQNHTWDGLLNALEDLFISAEAGYAALGSDIGGYVKNYEGTETYIVPNSNLFIRWAQFGALMPIMENGGQSNDQHFPWVYGSAVVEIYRYYSKLHHQLVPYMWSYDLEAHNYGTPIVRVLGDGDDPIAEKWTYKLGEEIFCAAIYDNDTSRSVKFPSGNWIDYWDDDIVYAGGTSPALSYPLDRYPIFIKKGAIIPMNVDNPEPNMNLGDTTSAGYLTLVIYPDDTEASFNYNYDYNYLTDIVESMTIQCVPTMEDYTINFSTPLESTIIKIKNQSFPEYVYLSPFGELPMKSKANFESDSYGWYHNDSTKHTWIKFSDPINSVIIKKNLIASLSPSNYAQSFLNEGEEYYVDRDYTLLNIPDEFEGLTMIKTANNDKMKDSLSLNFNFQMSKDANIFVAYDHRLTPPSWLSNGFMNTNEVITVSDIELDYFNVWTSTVDSGAVYLGSNNAPDAQSAMYFVFFNPSYIKVYLEGCFASGQMDDNLSKLSEFPKIQPYNIAPWNYLGTENVSSIPLDVVDWVLVELRDQSDPSSVLAQRAAFLLKDGKIIDTNGCNLVKFLMSEDNYYISVKHRNHLAILSKSPIPVYSNSIQCDFTIPGAAYESE